MIRYTPHYTVADYQQWEGDWELWNGIPVAMTPSAFGMHQYVAANIVRELGFAVRSVGSEYYVLHEIDWVISEDMIVRPDIVVCDEIPDRHVQRAPLLVVEVLSPSTVEKDKAAKRKLYEEQGVHCYLMIDPIDRMVVGYSLNDAGRYDTLVVDDPIIIPLSTEHTVEISTKAIFT